MTFPDSPRVIFSRNPLVQVICQLRFPTVLEIGSVDPAGFQKLIRKQYPIYHKQTEQSPLGARVPKEFGDLIGRFGISVGGPTTHRFANEDESRSISLTPEFVSLTEDSYTQWEVMRDEIALMVSTLCESYEPVFFSRIGLRYRDEIIRGNLGLEDESWSNLIRPEMLGLLGVDALEPNIIELESSTLYSLDDQVRGGRIRINQGLTGESNADQIYRIDADLYVDIRKGVDDVVPILDQFNRTGGNFFRWAIRDKLSHALKPTPL